MDICQVYNRLVCDFFPFVPKGDVVKIQDLLNPLREADNNQFIRSPIPIYMAQGDIIDQLQYILLDNHAEYVKMNTRVMLITNTCDLTREENILIAPIISVDDIGPNINLNDLKRQRYYDYIFINEGNLLNCVVDLKFISSYPRDLLFKQIREIKSSKIEYSLTMTGHYLLMLKLSVFLLRSEDCDALSSRKI